MYVDWRDGRLEPRVRRVPFTGAEVPFLVSCEPSVREGCIIQV